MPRGQVHINAWREERRNQSTSVPGKEQETANSIIPHAVARKSSFSSVVCRSPKTHIGRRQRRQKYGVQIRTVAFTL